MQTCDYLPGGLGKAKVQLKSLGFLVGRLEHAVSAPGGRPHPQCETDAVREQINIRSGKFLAQRCGRMQLYKIRIFILD